MNVDCPVVQRLGHHDWVSRRHASGDQSKGGRGSSSNDVRLMVVATVLVFGSITDNVLESSLHNTTRSRLFAPEAVCASAPQTGKAAADCQSTNVGDEFASGPVHDIFLPIAVNLAYDLLGSARSILSV